MDEALSEIPLHVATLREVSGNGDTAIIRRHAHTLKGMAANISAPALEHVSLLVEKESKHDNIEAVITLLPGLHVTTPIL